MIMAIRMFSTLPSSLFAGLFVYIFIYLLELSHFKPSHPSCMLAAQAPVTACHSEFQMAPIFPLMARRSGRQHIREGGPRHAACSRGSIRAKRGMRGGRGQERRVFEHHASSDVFFLSFFMIIVETAFSFWGWCGMADCSIFASGWVLLMVELPCPLKLPLTPTALFVCGASRKMWLLFVFIFCLLKSAKKIIDIFM